VAAFGGGEVSEGVGGEVGVVGAIGGHVGECSGGERQGELCVDAGRGDGNAAQGN
jgi:hypothetical protein